MLEGCLKAYRAAKGAAAPETLVLTDSLADHLASLGRFDEAAKLLEESVRLQPDRFDTREPKVFGPWLPLAVLTARAGDVDKYRDQCGEMIRRFGESRRSDVAAFVSRIGTAIPKAVIDTNRPLELARRALATNPKSPNYLLALGAAEFRSGRYKEAVGTLERAATADEAPIRAQIHLFLALTHGRLGQADEARSALAEADRDLAEAPSKPDPITLQQGWHWRESTLARIIRREAAALLGVKPSEEKVKAAK